MDKPFRLTDCFCQIFRKLGFFDLTFDGRDEYVVHCRPDLKPWTPLYRVSMKVALPDGAILNSVAGAEYRLIDLVYALDDLDLGVELEISPSGYLDRWGLLTSLRQGAKHRKIPIRQIRETDDYDAVDIIVAALGSGWTFPRNSRNKQ